MLLKEKNSISNNSLSSIKESFFTSDKNRTIKEENLFRERNRIQKIPASKNK